MPDPTVTIVDGISVLGLGSPILSTAHLATIDDRLRSLARSSPRRPLVLASKHPRIFLAGAHLAEIAALDRHSSRGYALLGRSVISRLATFPAPTVAAVNGPCAGGGLDMVLACDRVVTGPRARFSHPGALRGLVTGWGGTTALPPAVGGHRSRRALLEASALDRSALHHLGAIPCGASRTLRSAVAEARRLGSLEGSRLDLWRGLKSGSFIDRFRVFVIHKL